MSIAAEKKNKYSDELIRILILYDLFFPDQMYVKKYHNCYKEKAISALEVARHISDLKNMQMKNC